MQAVLYELHEKTPWFFSSNLRGVPSSASCVSLGVWDAVGLFVENPEAQLQSPVSHEETGVVNPVANCWPRAGILQVQSCVALFQNTVENVGPVAYSSLQSRSLGQACYVANDVETTFMVHLHI